MMILTIAGRELRSMFLSPLAWAVLAVVEAILAFLFLQQLDLFIAFQSQLAMLESPPGVTEVVAMPIFSTAAIVLLLVVPLLTMRLLSEEKRQKTLPLLMSAPISMSEIVLGNIWVWSLFGNYGRANRFNAAVATSRREARFWAAIDRPARAVAYGLCLCGGRAVSLLANQPPSRRGCE